MQEGRVSRIQRFSTRDGPGIRTTVFLKGCPLACPWCHNPETQSAEQEVLYFEERCRSCGACAAACPEGAHSLGPAGRHVFERGRCRLRLDCVAACPFGALEAGLERPDPAEVVRIALRDEAYYRSSGGGMTLSGGEPLLQPEFAAAVLRGLREAGVGTAVDTCLHAPPAVVAGLAELVDLWLVDFKLADSGRHERWTGVPNELILDNLALLDRRPGTRLWVRLPLIAGVNDGPGDLEGAARRLAALRRVELVELLPYHALGVVKSRGLGRGPQRGFAAPDPPLVRRFAARLREAGLPVRPEE